MNGDGAAPAAEEPEPPSEDAGASQRGRARRRRLPRDGRLRRRGHRARVAREGRRRRSRSTTRSSRSPPTRSTPRCPRRSPGRSRRSSSSRTRRCPSAPSLCRIAAGAARRPQASPAQPAAEPSVEPPLPATAGNGAENATPVAARIASAHGVDVSSLAGTGPRGRVTKEDVLAAIEGNGDARERAAPAGPSGAAERQADPRPGRHARPVHEREPLDPHRHQLPHRSPSTCSTRAARS